MSWTSLKEKSEKVGILAFEEGGRLKKEVSGWIIAFTSLGSRKCGQKAEGLTPENKRLSLENDLIK